MIGPSATLTSSGKIFRYPDHCVSDGGRFITQPPAIRSGKLGRWFQLLIAEQLKADRATKRPGLCGCEQQQVIVRAAPLVRTAQDLWGTTKTEIQSRVRGRPRHRPTVIASLLQE